MVRGQRIVSDVRLLFQRLDARQYLEFDYVLAVRQSWKNVKQRQLVITDAAARIVS
jgi:hypothetical protein